MRHAAQKYAALARKHGLDPWEAATAAFEAMRTGAVRRLPGLHKLGNITLKRGIMGATDLYDWMRATVNGQPARRNLAISLLPEDRSGPVERWLLFNAFPVKFTLGPLNAKGTDVAMEELVLAAERLEIA